MANELLIPVIKNYKKLKTLFTIALFESIICYITKLLLMSIQNMNENFSILNAGNNQSLIYMNNIRDNDIDMTAYYIMLNNNNSFSTFYIINMMWVVLFIITFGFIIVLTKFKFD